MKRSGQRHPPITPDITPPPTFTPGTVMYNYFISMHTVEPLNNGHYGTS